MKKQQEQQVSKNESNVAMAQEEAREGGRKMHDLTRLRIERNRSARHARCALMRK